MKILHNSNENFVKNEIEINGDEKMLIKHQYSNVKKVYQTVGEILDNYFNCEEEH